MSINMMPRLVSEFDRQMDEIRLVARAAIVASGQAGTTATQTNSRTFRVTTSSDAAVRGMTLAVTLTESGAPAGLTVAATDDVVSA